MADITLKDSRGRYFAYKYDVQPGGVGRQPNSRLAGEGI